MKVTILKSFYDKKTNELYKVGQKKDFAKTRAKDLEKRELVRIDGNEQ